MSPPTFTRFVDRAGRRLAVGLLLVVAGCGGDQSALAPAGPIGLSIATLAWIMFAGAAVIFGVVMALTVIAWLAPLRVRRWLGTSRAVAIGGIAFPVVVLSALLVYGLCVTRTTAGSEGTGPVSIHVVGEQWWWRVNYAQGDGAQPVITANEIRIPTGTPVRLVLTAADVIHSIWIPRLAGKLDMIPGRTTTLVLEAADPGVYRGQCAEYCGAQHAQMAFFVVAMEPQAFDDWLATQRSPGRKPATPLQEEGRQAFLRHGCGACHTVRGTSAMETLGPDLTHVGSRLSIAAGMFPNNAGTLAGWIADAQHLKPGNGMPSFEMLRGQELRAIAAYLGSLE